MKIGMFSMVMSVVAFSLPLFLGCASPGMTDEEYYELERGLKVHWTFDDEFPEETVPSGEYEFVDAVKGKGLKFDGETTYLTVDEEVDLNFDSITVAFWFRNDGMPEGEVVFVWSKEDTDWGGDGWYLNSQAGGTEDAPSSLSFIADDSHSISLAEPRVLQKREIFYPEGDWVHIAVTYDKEAGEGAIYRNGEEMQSSTDEGLTISGIEGNKWIGFNSHGYDNAHLNGVLDEFKVYNRALDHSEVKALFGMQSECN